MWPKFPFKTFFPLLLSILSSLNSIHSRWDIFTKAFFSPSPLFPCVSLPLFPPNPLVVRNYRSAASQPVIIKHSSYKTQAGFTRPPGSSTVTHKPARTCQKQRPLLGARHRRLPTSFFRRAENKKRFQPKPLYVSLPPPPPPKKIKSNTRPPPPQSVSKERKRFCTEQRINNGRFKQW